MTDVKIWSKYSKLEKLGEGTYGVVYKAETKTTPKQFVAVKKFINSDQEEGVPLTAIREISLLKSLSHPNIIKFIEFECSTKTTMFVMEYFECDLKKLMDEQNGLSTQQIRKFMFQLLSSIAYCHSKFVMHRDLKLQNILIDKTSNDLKICDFGIARSITYPIQTMTHEVNTLWYRAPEILLSAKLYSMPTDIWAIGCIFAEMLENAPLFPGNSEIDQLYSIFQKKGTPTNTMWSGVEDFPNYNVQFPKWSQKPIVLKECKNADALDLLNKMLDYVPENRITAIDALNHKYFQNDDNNKNENANDNDDETQNKDDTQNSDDETKFLLDQLPPICLNFN